MEFALQLNEHILRNGKLVESFNDLDWTKRDKHQMIFGGLTSITSYHNYHQSSDRARTERQLFAFSGTDWECKLHYIHYMMGGVDCYLHFGKFYSIFDYDLTNETGWLRDMTIARMVMHDA